MRYLALLPLILIAALTAKADYVERDKNGVIVGSYDKPRPDAQEWLDPKTQELIDFKFPPEDKAERDRLKNLKADGDASRISGKLTGATPAQIETYVRDKIGAGSVTTQAEAKAALVKVETALIEVLKYLAAHAPPRAVPTP